MTEDEKAISQLTRISLLRLGASCDQVADDCLAGKLSVGKGPQFEGGKPVSVVGHVLGRIGHKTHQPLPSDNPNDKNPLALRFRELISIGEKASDKERAKAVVPKLREIALHCREVVAFIESELKK